MKIKILLYQFWGLFKQILFAKQSDKRYESDRQMLQRIAKKFAVLLFVIVMFDTLLDWSLGLIDLIIHLMHLAIQAIEYSLLISLERLLETNQQQSETIIVNVAIIIVLYLAFRLILATPALVVRIRKHFTSAWLRYMERESSIWQTVSFVHKIKCLGAYSFGTVCLLFLVT